MSTLKLQDRIYEGVTGVVSLENTLVIGDYFKVWPNEVFTVEIDLPGDTFGEIVMAENIGLKSEANLKISSVLTQTQPASESPT